MVQKTRLVNKNWQKTGQNERKTAAIFVKKIKNAKVIDRKEKRI